MNGYNNTMEQLLAVHSHLLDQTDRDGVNIQLFDGETRPIRDAPVSQEKPIDFRGGITPLRGVEPYSLLNEFLRLSEGVSESSRMASDIEGRQRE